MADSTIWQGQCFEDGGCTLLARIVGTDGADITQADVSAISLATYTWPAGTVVTAAAALTVASVVYDTLQTDSRWSYDGTGFNFAYEIPATTFSTGDSHYQAELKFTPASGAVYWVVYRIKTVDLFTG